MTAKSGTKNNTKPFYVGRSLVSFWIFGICNNFGYVVMLSAAQDILRVEEVDENNQTAIAQQTCLKDRSHRVCTEQSAGLVLMLNILPMFFVKLLAPFFIHYLPYGTRNALVVIIQVLSLILTALAPRVTFALAGVALASISCGLGEIMYLALAAHYSANTITAWSSGTGMAGILGAVLYAVMTDPRLLALTPRVSLLLMLFGPLVFALTYCFLLIRAPTVKKTVFYEPATWIHWSPNQRKDEKEKPGDSEQSTVDMAEISHSSTSLRHKLWVTVGLTKYMLPLGTVYFAQYFINQGLAELIIFDCQRGFNFSPQSQYKWYQVLYQIGVFISRSSISVLPLPLWTISWVLPVSQISIMCLLLLESLSPFLPHILMAYGIILLEGLVGGSAYGNTVRHVHQNVASQIKEFALLIVTAADTIGILLAALISMPVHNYICQLPYYNWL